MSTILERQFEKMGARARIHGDELGRSAPRTGIRIDIAHDARGEYFDIMAEQRATSNLQVIDIQPRMRHLLLMSRQGNDKHKFLCGHDERAWFVAAIPGPAGVSSVRTAMEALKPAYVRVLQDQHLHVKPKMRNRRRNGAFVRQGEWFFVPIPWIRPINDKLVLHNERISRGLGKPHMCEELFREGGELVYVSTKFPSGLTAQQHRLQISRRPELRHLHWIAQRRNPQVYVRGRIRHADHKTICLDGWHQVLMNTESQSVAMRHVAFLD